MNMFVISLMLFRILSINLLNASSSPCKVQFDRELNREYYVQVDTLPERVGDFLWHKTTAFRLQEEGYTGNTGFIVSFIVEADGTRTSIKFDRTVDKETDYQVRMVLKAMQLWKPAKCGDTPVPYLYSLPLKYYKERKRRK